MLPECISSADNQYTAFSFAPSYHIPTYIPTYTNQLFLVTFPSISAFLAFAV